MTLSRRFAAFFFAMFVLVLAGCAATPQQASTGQIIDDSVITTKVKAAIFQEPNLKSLEISVTTYKGVVQLSGFVGSSEIALKASAVARNVEGVQGVRNSLVVNGLMPLRAIFIAQARYPLLAALRSAGAGSSVGRVPSVRRCCDVDTPHVTVIAPGYSRPARYAD
eukprot:gene32068-36843_t